MNLNDVNVLTDIPQAAPSITTSVANATPENSSNTPTDSTQQNQIKPALIAIVIYIILQFVFFNTETVNVLVSGIFLGLAKNVDRKTNLIFYFSVLVFLILDDILLKHGLADPRGGVVVNFFTSIISGAIGAALPLGVMWITRKIRKV